MVFFAVFSLIYLKTKLLISSKNNCKINLQAVGRDSGVSSDREKCLLKP